MNGFGCEDAFAFLDGEELVGFYVFEGFFAAADPDDVEGEEAVGLGFAEAEGEGEFALGEVA